MTTPPRSPLFWILVVGGVGLASCCLMTSAVMVLGAFADDGAPASSTTTSTISPEGNEWLVATEIARGEGMTQPLTGGRWVAQYGSIVNNVVGRSGNFQWVQTNSGGSLYELTFDDDGSYAWAWASSLTMNGQKYQSHSTEKGRWELSGTQLVLTPESQAAEYSNSSSTQRKEDENLAERRYTVLDLTLETLDDPKQQVPAVMMIGPKAAWDTGTSDQLSLTLQRLSR